MTLLDPVLTGLNSLGHSVTSGVVQFLSVNHVLASTAVSTFCVLASIIKDVLSTLTSAVVILLEDLFDFLVETGQSFVAFCEVIFAFVDAFVSGILSGLTAIKTGTLWCFYSVTQFFSQILTCISDIFYSISGFLRLLGSSVMLLIQMIPSTLYLCGVTLVSFIQKSTTSCKNVLLDAYQTVFQSPAELLIGLISGILIFYSVNKLTRRIIREHNLTFSGVMRSTFRVFCVSYLLAIRGLLKVVFVVLDCVTTVLTHLHVPRFHHAGDIDDDDEEEQGKKTKYLYSTIKFIFYV